MVTRGVVGRQLIEDLLVHKVVQNNIPVVINMMIKYGLIVILEQPEELISLSDETPYSIPDKYLVPALLPSTVGDTCSFQDTRWNSVQHFNTCYFVFGTQSNLSSSQSLCLSQLKSECFLPRGLMERLIGKAVVWSQLTSISSRYQAPALYKNYAVLSYGHQLFRLVCIYGINCIRLDIEGEHPLPAHTRISEQIEKCIGEHMGMLHFITALRLGAATESDDEFVLVNLQGAGRVQSNIRAESPPLNIRDVCYNLDPWLQSKEGNKYYTFAIIKI